MNDAPKYTTLRDYLRVVRERRALIALVVLAFAGAALAISLRQEPVYEAEASISFASDNEGLSDIGAAQPITETPEQRAAVKAESLLGIDLAERAKKKLRTRLTPAQLLSVVEAGAEARTHFVVVTARSRNPLFAAATANAFADAAVEVETREVRERYEDRAKVIAQQTRRLRETPSTDYTRAANVDRINRLRNLAEFATPAVIAVRASRPSTPVSPKPVRNTALGLIVGLTFGFIAAFLRDALDRRLKSSREIREELHLPLVGHVREEVLGRSFISQNGSIAFSDQEFEAFKILRTNVEFLDIDSGGSTVVVTSALPEEGKSTVASALAAAYATAGRRALLVECDLRRPTLATRYGLKPTPGLTDYLIDGARPQDVLQTIPMSPQGIVNGTPVDSGRSDGPKPLVCITAGTPLPQPAELLGSKKFRSFLEQVAGVYDTVILDTAPLLSVVDTLELVPVVDRVVLCVRASRTTRDQARAAKAALEHFPARPTGVVVTGVRSGDEADYGYYSYAYAYGPRT